jgi:pimeloyl-ACP methyl ester carboxylesterase
MLKGQPPSTTVGLVTRRGAQNDHGLRVHKVDPDHAKDTLLVFIHGLGGGVGTWGKFPELIASDPAFPTDYAFFDYLSLFGRFFRHATSLTEVVKFLIDQIRFTEYRKVVLVGHSMGGNIARAAVRHIHSVSLISNRDYIRIQGLILFASPMLGSSFYFTQATKDGRFVAAYSDELSEIMRFFSHRVDTTIDAPPTDRLNIPVFAAIALRDRVVRPMSSQELVPELQVHRIDSTHRKIVKPESCESNNYRWLKDSITKCINRRSARLRFAEGATNYIFARYTCSSKHADWQEKYIAACLAVKESDGVEIIDITHGEDAVNVSICVAEDDEITQGRYNGLIQQEATAQARDHLMSLYLGAIGMNHSEAISYAQMTLLPPKAGMARFITGLPDATTLESTISNWLHLVSARKRQSSFGRSTFALHNDLYTPNQEDW